MFSMGTLFLQIQIMSDMSDFHRIFRIMSNSIILKIGFEYIYLTSILKTNTNTDIHINAFSGYEYG
jgi:hypothetical protein